LWLFFGAFPNKKVWSGFHTRFFCEKQKRAQTVAQSLTQIANWKKYFFVS
jgi:hypothetical protein